MRPVILDIGAESKRFLLSLSHSNRNLSMLMFAGEPEWHKPNISKEKTGALIADKKAVGIYRVVSRYSALAFPNESVDLITLSSPHGTFVLEHKMFEQEVVRCLKPNGYLFFDFASDAYCFESGNLVCLGKGFFSNDGGPVDIGASLKLPNHIPNKISPGRVLSEIIEQMKNPLWGGLMRRIHVPTFEVWQKCA